MTFVAAVHGTEVLLPWVLNRGRQWAIFTCGSKSSIRERCREGLPARCKPGVGRTKGLTACLASETRLISDFESFSQSLSSVNYCRFDVLKMLRGCCVFVVARHYRVLATWAFSWVMGRSSGWRLFIPSSFVAWPLSKTFSTSWSISIMTLVSNDANLEPKRKE